VGEVSNGLALLHFVATSATPGWPVACNLNNTSERICDGRMSITELRARIHWGDNDDPNLGGGVGGMGSKIGAGLSVRGENRP
jgi:hypothetical protein